MATRTSVIVGSVNFCVLNCGKSKLKTPISCLVVNGGKTKMAVMKIWLLNHLIQLASVYVFPLFVLVMPGQNCAIPQCHVYHQKGGLSSHNITKQDDDWSKNWREKVLTIIFSVP